MDKMHTPTDFAAPADRGEVDQDRAKRLRQARIALGFDSAAACSQTFGWKYTTYVAHENGSRGIPHETLIRYAGALLVPLDWLSYGRGARDMRSIRIRIEGYVTKNLEINLRAEPTEDEIPDDAPGPPGVEAGTLTAWRFAGDDGAPFFPKGTIVYTPRAAGPPAGLIGRICVVFTVDDKVLLRVLRAHLGGARFLLLDFAQRATEAEIVKAVPIAWTHHPDN